MRHDVQCLHNDINECLHYDNENDEIIIQDAKYERIIPNLIFRKFFKYIPWVSFLKVTIKMSRSFTSSMLFDVFYDLERRIENI